MDRKIVIIPTYNEKENIEAITRKVFSLPGEFQILVIDDGSPDGTAGIVKGLQAEFPERLHLLERSGKQGLGTAYLTGFKWSLEHGYDYVFEMDADFSHNPDDLLRLYAACAEQGADLSVGSRYCHGVSVVDWPMSRIIMSYYASAYVRGVLDMKVFDTTAGFVCYSRKVLETIDLDAPGRRPDEGIRFPDRDEVHGLPPGIQDRRGADHLHEPPAGHLQDVQRHLRGSLLGRDQAPVPENQGQAIKKAKVEFLRFFLGL